MKWADEFERAKDPKTGKMTVGTRTLQDVGTACYQVKHDDSGTRSCWVNRRKQASLITWPN